MEVEGREEEDPNTPLGFMIEGEKDRGRGNPWWVHREGMWIVEEAWRLHGRCIR